MLATSSAVAEQTGCICGSVRSKALLFRARDYVSGELFDLLRCGTCGTAHTTPIPRKDDWAKYYPPAYYGRVEMRRFPKWVEAAQNILYQRRARRVERLAGVKAGRVLDVGCGRGHLLNAFRKCGWDVTGTEFSEAAAQYARLKLRLPVRVGELAELEFPPATFDAVVLWHVLEHAADPAGTVREVHRLLRPGGVLFIGVPNFGSVEARLARDKWFHLDVPRHLTHFTAAGLVSGLKQCGFGIERRSFCSPEYDLFSSLQSLLNRAGLAHNLLYSVLRQRGAKFVSARRQPIAQLLAHLLLLPPFFLSALASALLCPALRHGATQSLWARKPPV